MITEKIAFWLLIAAMFMTPHFGLTLPLRLMYAASAGLFVFDIIKGVRAWKTSPKA